MLNPSRVLSPHYLITVNYSYVYKSYKSHPQWKYKEDFLDLIEMLVEKNGTKEEKELLASVKREVDRAYELGKKKDDPHRSSDDLETIDFLDFDFKEPTMEIINKKRSAVFPLLNECLNSENVCLWIVLSCGVKLFSKTEYFKKNLKES